MSRTRACPPALGNPGSPGTKTACPNPAVVERRQWSNQCTRVLAAWHTRHPNAGPRMSSTSAQNPAWSFLLARALPSKAAGQTHQTCRPAYESDGLHSNAAADTSSNAHTVPGSAPRGSPPNNNNNGPDRFSVACRVHPSTNPASSTLPSGLQSNPWSSKQPLSLPVPQDRSYLLFSGPGATTAPSAAS